MAKIQVKIEYPIKDGTSFTFHAPCDCSEVDGLTVTHPHGKQDFVFKDAHGNALTGINNLFASGALIQAVLDVTKGAVFLQNADTNSYVERIVGVERARIDTLVVRNNTATGDLDTLELDDGDTKFPFRATIISNGVNCHIDVDVSEADLGVGVGNEAVSNIQQLPLNFAPLSTVVYETETYHFSMEVVSIDKDAGTADVRFVLKSKIDDEVSVQTVAMYYPVLYPSTPETRDIRVGSDGETTYATAGEAVRAAQQMAIDNTEMMNDFNDDLGRALREIEELKKNGTGGGGLTITDDGNGNVTMVAVSGVSITDDGNGNVVIK